MIPDNDAGNESNEIPACDHHHVRLGVIWGYWVSSDKWHYVSSRNSPGSKLIFAQIVMSGTFVSIEKTLRTINAESKISELF